MNIEQLKERTVAWSKGEDVDFPDYFPFEYKRTPTIFWSKYFYNDVGRRVVKRFGEIRMFDDRTRGE